MAYCMAQDCVQSMESVTCRYTDPNRLCYTNVGQGFCAENPELLPPGFFGTVGPSLSQAFQDFLLNATAANCHQVSELHCGSCEHQVSLAIDCVLQAKTYFRSCRKRSAPHGFTWPPPMRTRCAICGNSAPTKKRNWPPYCRSWVLGKRWSRAIRLR